jgi:hypothetical protein
MQSFAVLAGLHILNPDAFIVRTNLNRPAEERPFDAEHAVTLGSDAVPALLEALPKLNPTDRCIVVPALLNRWGGDEAPDWRTWNWSRARARKLVRSRTTDLLSACPTATKETRNDH